MIVSFKGLWSSGYETEQKGVDDQEVFFGLADVAFTRRNSPVRIRAGPLIFVRRQDEAETNP